MLAYLAKLYLNENAILSEQNEALQRKIVDFPALEVAWPVIKPLKSKAEATELFKLGNTQYQKALKFYIVDGYVTEHYRIQTGV